MQNEWNIRRTPSKCEVGHYWTMLGSLILVRSSEHILTKALQCLIKIFILYQYIVQQGEMKDTAEILII